MAMEIITTLQFFLVLTVVVYLTANMLDIVRAQSVVGGIIDAPFISICVPARNEERDIEACLRSLLNQDYPNFEVIVVDDNSTDRTGEIIESLSPEFPRLLHKKVSELPDGWLGKPHALYQARKAAKGEYLLFTDADPVFQSNTLTSAIYMMNVKGLDVLTLMPRAIFGSFWERAVQPVIFAFIVSLTRFKKVNDNGHKDAMGVGAFIMIKTEIYDQIGGHERLKDAVLEDIGLAKITKMEGYKLMVADGKNLISIRMYHSLNEIWTGWKKNLFIAMKKSVLKTIYYLFIVFAFILTPYVVLIFNLTGDTHILFQLMAGMGLLLSLMTCVNLCQELDLEKRNIFLFPLGAVVMAGIMINSMFQCLIKREVEWRGRKYAA